MHIFEESIFFIHIGKNNFTIDHRSKQAQHISLTLANQCIVNTFGWSQLVYQTNIANCEI